MPDARSRPAGVPIKSLLALAAALFMLAVGSPVAVAQTGDGQITGVVADSGGHPIADITVAAVPVGGDTIVSTKTKANGAYVLNLAPGFYDVAFNAQVVAKINLSYQTVIFGGPGPGPDETCTVCDGAPVPVAAGVVTANIDGVLPPGQATQTGIRPLSGNTIGLVNGRIAFKLGCHVDPAGCHGTANLRLGTSTSGPLIATAKVAIRSGEVGLLHFTIPPSVRSRLARAGVRGLRALVTVTTPHARSVTRFKLRS